MKRFIVSILCVAVFFIGLGNLVEKVGAKFKSDDRALEIIAQARQAIGGEAAIKNVRALSITGRAAQTFNIEGIERVEQGDLEINLQLPNQFAKTLRFNRENGGAGEKRIERDVIVIRKSADKADGLPDLPADGKKKVFILKKGDANAAEVSEGDRNADVKKIIVDKDLKFSRDGAGQNELFRTTFALLLSLPEGSDAAFTYGGDASIDGNSCDVVIAQLTNDAVKLFIDKSTHLPLMMSFQGVKPFVIKFNKNEIADTDVKNFRIISRTATSETVEIQVKFSDYRTIGDLKLPFKWTQTANGQTDRNVDVSNYDINPANIAEKFKETPERVMFKLRKPE